MPVLQYPFDPTGLLESNHIVDEQHAVTDANFRDYYFVVPKFSPFFAQSIVVKHYNLDEVRELVPDVDYYPALQFVGATRSLTQAVYGAITLNSTIKSGIVSIEYRTVGGPWIADRNYVLERLAEKIYNPRLTLWETVTNVQEVFPPIDHNQAYGDMLGQRELIESIDKLRDKMVESRQNNQAVKHFIRTDNPHKVTKTQVGLSLVQNFSPASAQDTLRGQAQNLYVTPAGVGLVKEVIEQSIAELVSEQDQTNTGLSERIDETNQVLTTQGQSINALTNAVTQLGNKLDVHIREGLGAHSGETLSQSISGAHQALSTLANAFTTHRDDTNNPHETTASQVGLPQVANIPVADPSEVANKDPVTKYVTLEQVLSLIAGLSIGNPGTVVGYNVTASSTIVNEGDPIDFTINTTGVVDGTLMYWSVIHDSTAPADFPASQGSFTVFANSALVRVETFADALPEGTEQFLVRIYKDGVGGPVVAQSPTIQIKNVESNAAFDLTPTGTTTGNSVAPVYTYIGTGTLEVPIEVTTTNIPDGTTVYWTVTNSTLPTGALVVNSGSVQIVSNAATISVVMQGVDTAPLQGSFVVQLRLSSVSGSVVSQTPVIAVVQTQDPVTLVVTDSLFNPAVKVDARSYFITGSNYFLDNTSRDMRYTYEPIIAGTQTLGQLINTCCLLEPGVTRDARTMFVIGSGTA